MRTLRKEALAGYRKALVARLLSLKGAQISDKAVLEANYGHLGEDMPAMASHATQLDLSVALVTARDNELRLVETALERLGDGTYGFCEMCSEPIPLIRLNAVPSATRCVECQREVERARGIWERESILPEEFDLVAV